MSSTMVRSLGPVSGRSLLAGRAMDLAMVLAPIAREVRPAWNAPSARALSGPCGT
ncbi:MAG: hypothetical protein MUF00_11045 [Gemmatimonadaceae bacterium]|nr:hypothetical protein [Gemmatimonadaceae bacterium]